MENINAASARTETCDRCKVAYAIPADDFKRTDIMATGGGAFEALCPSCTLAHYERMGDQ